MLGIRKRAARGGLWLSPSVLLMLMRGGKSQLPKKKKSELIKDRLRNGAKCWGAGHCPRGGAGDAREGCCQHRRSSMRKKDLVVGFTGRLQVRKAANQPLVVREGDFPEVICPRHNPGTKSGGGTRGGSFFIWSIAFGNISLVLFENVIVIRSLQGGRHQVNPLRFGKDLGER